MLINLVDETNAIHCYTMLPIKNALSPQYLMDDCQLITSSRQGLTRFKDIPILLSSTTTVDTEHDLEVVLGSQLTMSAQVRSVCQLTYNYIHQLCPVFEHCR